MENLPEDSSFHITQAILLTSHLHISKDAISFSHSSTSSSPSFFINSKFHSS